LTALLKQGMSEQGGVCLRRFCIATYPGVQERVIAELDEAGLLVTASRPEPRELKQDDLKDLVVLEAVRAHALP
jgi:hypothetical protein